MKILSVAEMVRIEQAADAAGHPYAAMMEQAGRGVAASLLRALHSWDSSGSVLVLVGPGNNGGDGLVAARYVRQWQPQRQIIIYTWRRSPDGDANYEAARQLKITIQRAEDDPDFASLQDAVLEADVIIDALLGTGVARPITGQLAELLAAVQQSLTGHAQALAEAAADFDPPPPTNAHSAAQAVRPVADYDFLLLPPWPAPPEPYIVAVDCPSGLNCDTGLLDPAALHADLTVTFAFPKTGHFIADGPAACGRLEIADIGVDDTFADTVSLELATPTRAQSWLPRRPSDANKGTFGKALLVAGSANYTGAAHLASLAAYRAGAGLVTCGIPASLHTALAAGAAEPTWLLLPEVQGVLHPDAAVTLAAQAAGYKALLVGSGLTQQPAAVQFIHRLLGAEGDSLRGLPWVLDADALNVLAQQADWPRRLPSQVILTPHPGEMARLCGCDVRTVQADRIHLARAQAAAWQAVVVLKGAYTVVAAPDGRTVLLPFANPALATAGSGDVLAGAIVGLLAQGLPPFEAACCGGYLHGLAGELARRELGDAGVVAGDLLPRLPLALRQLRAA